jgi:serine O-acetyltransferase
VGGILRRIVPPERTLHILTADIGLGTRFVHGFAIVLLAERIGDDCQIFQNVTVGDSPSKAGLPTIGDRVSIFPGAVISGPITIGDDVVIGANSVVTMSVPAGEVWAGAPARRIGFSSDLEALRR